MAATVRMHECIVSFCVHICRQTKGGGELISVKARGMVHISLLSLHCVVMPSFKILPCQQGARVCPLASRCHHVVAVPSVRERKRARARAYNECHSTCGGRVCEG